MPRKYFIARYQLNHKSRYLIWFSTDEDGDGVYTVHGRMPIFRSQDNVQAYAKARDIELTPEEPILHNFDIVRKDLKRKRPVQINCNEMLAAWNLFSDVANSLEVAFNADQVLTRHIYNRLFWGSNIPAVTPPGEHFTPRWSRGQHKIMREVLAQGFTMFTSAASLTPAAPRAQ